MKKGYIYKIVNPNGKIYIGQTINIEARKKAYKNKGCKRQPLISNSINKYGWENHTFEVIDEVWTGYKNCILNIREIYWINEYNSFRDGLNLTEGGNVRTNYVVSEETKKKISEANKGHSRNKGKKMSEESKKKMSDKAKGRKAWNAGIGHTEEAKKKMSEALKGKSRNKGWKHTEEAKKKMSDNTKKIKITIDGIDYDSYHDASRKLNIPVTTLCRRYKKLLKETAQKLIQQ